MFSVSFKHASILVLTILAVSLQVTFSRLPQEGIWYVENTYLGQALE